MAQATFTVTLPERLWVREVSSAHPETCFHVIAGVPGADTGFALVRLTGPNLAEVLEDMDDHDQLTEISLIQWSDNEATVHFETTAPLLLFSSRNSGMPIELPVKIRDGEATMEVTGSRARLSQLAEQFSQFGLQYHVDNVQERLHDSQLLSERQQELIVAAVKHGYYDTPRCCSLTELAERLGIAKSTCSETLHRAEEAIVKEFVDNLANVDSDALIEKQLA
ncbi:helix-turn-helix domain-containing protein [Halobacteria archaeon AArc-curdl1]|uniref:Helix-turn-helix domain-containing protein n=1 Tax=Natronosalvus hydrolyticus TaxID=2979988 RepID=A0AAP2Z9T0_9EURY|nr:helix-turn-helix domain-containing protein [Halobacteria archaeon AArc-curdl1]